MQCVTPVSREATQRCPRCGNLYCPARSSSFCAACLDPLSLSPLPRHLPRSPSSALFGGASSPSGSLVRPPGRPRRKTSPAMRQPTTFPGPDPGRRPAAPRLPARAPLRSPAPPPASPPTDRRSTRRRRPEAPTAAPGPVQYTVQAGDTWFGIAGSLRRRRHEPRRDERPHAGRPSSTRATCSRSRSSAAVCDTLCAPWP